MSSSSKRQLNLTIDGMSYQIEVEDLSAPTIKVWVNGEPHQVRIERPPVPTEEVTAPAPRPDIRAATPAPTPTRTGFPTSANITAPMPGNLLDIMVQPGDTVEVGQQICSLEAMKMKSAVRSGRQGVVATVEVAPGQAVAYGDVLITFE